MSFGKKNSWKHENPDFLVKLCEKVCLYYFEKQRLFVADRVMLNQKLGD